MSGLQWLFVIGLGVAGYLLVSFVIDRVKREKQEPAPPLDDRPREQTLPPSSPSAWDEFSKGQQDRK